MTQKRKHKQKQKYRNILDYTHVNKQTIQKKLRILVSLLIKEIINIIKNQY